jgi:hypothetical protein
MTFSKRAYDIRELKLFTTVALKPNQGVSRKRLYSFSGALFCYFFEQAKK